MTWPDLSEVQQQLVIGAGGSLIAAFIGWVWKKFWKRPQKQSGGSSIQQTASPTITQTVHVNSPTSGPSRIPFEEVQARNKASREEAQERKILNLEKHLHRLIVEVKLVCTHKEYECADRVTFILQDISRFFYTDAPAFQYLNVDILKYLRDESLQTVMRELAASMWAECTRGECKDDPCEMVVNQAVELLFQLKLRPGWTMKNFDQALPK